MRLQLAVLVLCSGCLRPTQELSPPTACTQADLQHRDGCGGDLVGTWRLSCYESQPDMSLTESSDSQRLTFKSDGTYAFSPDGDYSLIVSSSYARDGGGCATLDERASLYDGTCADAGSGDCRCDYTAAGLAMNGTYSTSGPQVSFTYSPKTPILNGVGLPVTVTQDYCVSGETLTTPTRFGNFIVGGVFTRE